MTQSIWVLYPVNSLLSDHLSRPGANTQCLICRCCISIPQIISIAFVLNLPHYTYSSAGKATSYLVSSINAGNNTVCVSPVLAHCCILRPCCSSGLMDKEVQLRTGQLCLGSHFSVTEGADHGPEAAEKPTQQPSSPSCLLAQETPPGLHGPHPNLGIAAGVCASPFQGRPRASPPLCSFSAESLPLPPGTAAPLAAPLACVHVRCVCVCI